MFSSEQATIDIEVDDLRLHIAVVLRSKASQTPEKSNMSWWISPRRTPDHPHTKRPKDGNMGRGRRGLVTCTGYVYCDCLPNNHTVFTWSISLKRHCDFEAVKGILSKGIILFLWFLILYFKKWLFLLISLSETLKYQHFYLSNSYCDQQDPRLRRKLSPTRWVKFCRKQGIWPVTNCTPINTGSPTHGKPTSSLISTL